MIRRIFHSAFPRAEPAVPGGWSAALLIALFLGVASVLLYLPAASFQLVFLDDPVHTGDPLVTGGWSAVSVARAFTESTGAYPYTPLTRLSFMLEAAAFGGTPRVFHLTNVALFGADMALLFLVLWRMTGSPWKSAFAAALVAFHPMRVESVAWVAERKDVLSLLFLLMALASHVRYARTGSARWYGALLLCALLAVLAKPLGVILPFLLLLVDFWPLRRFVREGEDHSGGADANRYTGAGDGSSPRRGLFLLAEKVPLLILSAVVSLHTLRFHEQWSSIRAEFSILSRVEHSLTAVFLYLGQTVFPCDLALRYLETPWERFSGALLPAAAGVAALSWLLLRRLRTFPFLAFGWGWYLAALLPNSGIVPAGMQWLSDRFTLVPHVGVAVAVVWFAAAVAAPRPGRGGEDRVGVTDENRLRGGPGGNNGASDGKFFRRVLPASGVAVLVLLALLSRRQLYFWRDSATLLGKGLAQNGSDPTYIGQYVTELSRVGEFSRAREQLDRILPRAMDPVSGGSIRWDHLDLLEREGGPQRVEEAARGYLSRDPALHDVRLRLADALLSVGRYREAGAEYGKALEGGGLSATERGHAFEGAGLSLAASGMEDEARRSYEEGLREQPGSASLHGNLAFLLASKGEVNGALFHFGEALRIDPRNLPIRIAVGDLLRGTGDREGAAESYRQVAAAAPAAAEGLVAAGRLLELEGKGGEGRRLYESALSAPFLFPGTPDLIRRTLSLPPPS